MSQYILAINPGSTSTKIGLFDGEAPVFMKTIEHTHAELQGFANIVDQKGFRMALVLEILRDAGFAPGQLAGVVGRGGLFPPLEMGGYIVNERMIERIVKEEGVSPHASNLGALLAAGIAAQAGVDAYIYDAVSAGPLPEVAQITGIPELRRRSLAHVLNGHAQGLRYAATRGLRFEDLNLIVAHLGGGVSIAAYEKGRLIDSMGEGYLPFSPERAGGVPLFDFVDFLYDNNLTKQEARRRVRGGGGLVALLGTADCRKAVEMMERGDANAETVLQAMCYGMAKGIGALAAVLGGNCDAILLTGGVANSKFVTAEIAARVGFLAEVVIYPGEYELEALAAGCLRILNGAEAAREME
ncbi:MAG: butyrate kinase [Clostridiales bacterium]|nr:butyrate kinase [Clostridiales bacterium]